MLPPRRRGRLALPAATVAIAAAAWLLATRIGSPPRGSVAPERLPETVEAGSGVALVAPRPDGRAPPGAPSAEASAEDGSEARDEPLDEEIPLDSQQYVKPSPTPFTLLLRAVDPDGVGVANARFDLAGRAVGQRRWLEAERDGTCVVELEVEVRAPRLRQLLVAASAPGRVDAARLLLDEDIPGPGGLSTVELVLAPAVVVWVRVRDPLGAPAAGAVVRLVPADGARRVFGGDGSRHLDVDSDGFAIGEGFAPGKWTLQVDEWRDWAIGPYEIIELELGAPNVFELVARRFTALEHASGRVVAADGSALAPDELLRLGLRRVGERVRGARIHDDGAFFVPLAKGARQSWEVFDFRSGARSAPFALRGGWHGLEVRLSPGG